MRGYVAAALRPLAAISKGVCALLAWSLGNRADWQRGAMRPMALVVGGLVGGVVLVWVYLTPGQASVQKEPLASVVPVAVAAKAAPAPPRWQTLVVRSGDTLSELFSQAGLTRADVQRVMALGAPVKTLRVLHPGDKILFRTDSQGQLCALRYAEDPLQTLEVQSGPDGLQAQVQRLQPTVEQTIVGGTVNETLGAALRRAGLDTSQVARFVDIFHWRVDFRREIRKGTRFTVVYQTRHVGDRQLAPGPIVAAELQLNDQTLRAFRFTSTHGDTGYYDSRGRSLHPTLLRTPVHYTRVSSPFSLHRFDPVAHVWRPHYGVDLAAPIGTPVHAAGDGRVIYAGRDGGYGNLVKIKNFGPYTTRYAHLRRFAHGLHVGSHVHQGQVIGYVGETGMATGPHLHFEIRVNGIARNPLKVRLPAGAPLNRRERRRFEADIRPLMAKLEKGSRSQPQLARAARTLAANDHSLQSGKGLVHLARE